MGNHRMDMYLQQNGLPKTYRKPYSSTESWITLEFSSFYEGLKRSLDKFWHATQYLFCQSSRKQYQTIHRHPYEPRDNNHRFLEVFYSTVRLLSQ